MAAAARARSGGKTATKATKSATKTAAKKAPTRSAPKVAKSAAKETTPRPTAKAATKTLPRPAAKAAAKPDSKKTPAPKAQVDGVRRGEAPRRAEGAKRESPARGLGGSPGGQTRPLTGAPPPTEPADPATLHLTAAPVLHRILTCHVPDPAIARLEAAGDSLFSAARHALQSGIRALEHEISHASPNASASDRSDQHTHTRPVAVPAGLAAALLVTRLAEECFGGDVHVAGGWLVARGAGHPITLPTPSGAVTRQVLLGAIRRLAASERLGNPSKAGRAGKSGERKSGAVKSVPAADVPSTSGARVSAPLILVPAGPQLRAMREALGVSREEVAQVAGLTPDTVGEIERDKRPTAAARLQVAEVLCGMNPATRLEA